MINEQKPPSGECLLIFLEVTLWETLHLGRFEPGSPRQIVLQKQQQKSVGLKMASRYGLQM
jgi:hypothetical protein